MAVIKQSMKTHKVDNEIAILEEQLRLKQMERDLQAQNKQAALDMVRSANNIVQLIIDKEEEVKEDVVEEDKVVDVDVKTDFTIHLEATSEPTTRAQIIK